MNRARHRQRGGFTLVEVMIASTISLIAALAICSGMSACYQLYESMMADTELSLRAREIRDKLLFHEAAPANGVFHTGLLSGKSPTIDTVALNMTCEAVGESGARSDRQLRLILNGTGTSTHLFEDATRVNADWLAPNAIWVNSSWGDLVRTEALAGNRIYIDLPLSISARRPFGAPAVITRTERITVPLFGRVQPYVLNDKLEGDQ